MDEKGKMEQVVELLRKAEEDAKDAKMYARLQDYERLVKYLGDIMYNLYCARRCVMQLVGGEREVKS